MTRKLLIVIPLMGVMILGNVGCATILSGTSQTVKVNSTPEGANVALGPFEGKTPASFVVPKGKDYPLTITHNGETKKFVLTRSFDNVGWINILFWPGFIVDLATGAMTKYEPQTYDVSFE